jgi:hypothetical protein
MNIAHANASVTVNTPSAVPLGVSKTETLKVDGHMNGAGAASAAANGL